MGFDFGNLCGADSRVSGSTCEKAG